MAGISYLLNKRVGHTLHAWHVMFDAADQPVSSPAKEGVGEEDLSWRACRCQKPGHHCVAHLTHASWVSGMAPQQVNLAQSHLGGPEVEFVTTTHTGNKFNIRSTQVGLS